MKGFFLAPGLVIKGSTSLHHLLRFFLNTLLQSEQHLFIYLFCKSTPISQLAHRKQCAPCIADALVPTLHMSIFCLFSIC